MAAGGTLVVTSTPEDATGAGALLGIPQGTVGSALTVQGAVEASQGAGNLLKDALAPMQSSGNGPKAKDAPGVSSTGQATDEHGNKLGGSGKPQQYDTQSNTQEGAHNKALNEGSTAVNHSNPREGKPHYHAGDAEGNKKPNSTHHRYPD